MSNDYTKQSMGVLMERTTFDSISGVRYKDFSVISMKGIAFSGTQQVQLQGSLVLYQANQRLSIFHGSIFYDVPEKAAALYHI